MRTRSTVTGRAASARLVLRATDAEAGIGERRRMDDDLREPHDGDDVLHRDLLAVDLLEEVDHLLVAAELRVVVLDVPRRQVADALDLDLVDDRVEDLLAWRVLVADGHHHRLVLLVLVRLVAQADRRRLPAALELVGEDRGVEVQDLHPTAETTRRRPSATGRGPPCRARPGTSGAPRPPRAAATRRARPPGRARRRRRRGTRRGRSRPAWRCGDRRGCTSTGRPRARRRGGAGGPPPPAPPAPAARAGARRRGGRRRPPPRAPRARRPRAASRPGRRGPWAARAPGGRWPPGASAR